MLSEWLSNPLTDIDAINRRLDAVAEFHADAVLCQDLPRTTRADLRPTTPHRPHRHRPSQPARPQLPRQDAVAAAEGQGQARRPHVAAAAGTRGQPRSVRRGPGGRRVRHHRGPAGHAPRGGVIRDGFSPELDELRDLESAQAASRSATATAWGSARRDRARDRVFEGDMERRQPNPAGRWCVDLDVRKRAPSSRSPSEGRIVILSSPGSCRGAGLGPAGTADSTPADLVTPSRRRSRPPPPFLAGIYRGSRLDSASVASPPWTDRVEDEPLLDRRTRRSLAFGLTLLLSFALVACSSDREAAEPGSELERQLARAENVTIVRDDFGVPHVYGKTDADAVFGLLYAQAEDDFPRIERNYIWATGRLAEVEGEDALLQRPARTAVHDRRRGEAQPMTEAPEPGCSELCDAWADGLNYYMLSHPGPEAANVLEQVSSRGCRCFSARGQSAATSSRFHSRRIARVLWTSCSTGIEVEQELASRTTVPVGPGE